MMQKKAGTLYFQIIHNRVTRQISTGYKLFPSEWDRSTQTIVIAADIAESRKQYLVTLENQLRVNNSKLNNIVARLERTGELYTADDVVEHYFMPSDSGGFLSFAHTLIIQLKQIGKMRTAETYMTVLNSFIRFRGEESDLSFEEVDADLMTAYESYLKSTGVCPNSSSFYMRNLRAMYNRAVNKSLTTQRNPFKYVYTGIDKTVKRAVSIKVIRQIRDLDLMPDSAMELARDLFMFSFYTRGMSFVDMSYLRKKDLQNGILSYRRKKTNQQLFIKWEKPMQEIIDKYDTKETAYLLPIITDDQKDEHKQYKNTEHLVNDKLKKIGKKLGLPIPLTTYVARHTWASIAKNKNIPITIISEAMGHDSEGTTRIYLASLDTAIVDKANSMILKSI